MDIGDISLLVGMVIAVCTAVTGALATAWKWAKGRAKEEILQEQSAATIKAKNDELEDLKEENVRLWKLLEGKTQ